MPCKPWYGYRLGWLFIFIYCFFYVVYYYYHHRKNYLYATYHFHVECLDLLRERFRDAIAILIYIFYRTVLYQFKLYLFIIVYFYPFYDTLGFKVAFADLYNRRFKGYCSRHPKFVNFILFLVLSPIYLEILFHLIPLFLVLLL